MGACPLGSRSRPRRGPRPKTRPVRRIAAPAALAAAKHVGPIAQRYGQWRDRRVDRDRAVKLARQMGGRVSEDTIIA